MLIVADTGPLYAVADEADPDHQACLEVLGRGDARVVVPVLVLAEAGYLIGSRLGAAAEAAFLDAMADYDVEPVMPDDLRRMGQLVEKYGDWPLGTVDASVAATAERLAADAIVTLDRRHFGPLRSVTGEPFDLLPAVA